MKNIIKNTFYYAGALFVASTMFSCQDTLSGNDENLQEGQEKVEMKTITVTAQAVASRTVHTEEGNNIKVQWTENDVIYIGTPANVSEVSISDETSGFKACTVASISNDGKTATFEYSVPATYSEGTLLAFYGNAENIKIANSTVKLDFASQVQTDQALAHLANYDLMSAVATYDGGENLSLNFNHEGAILKVNIAGLPDGDKSLQDVTLSASDAIFNSSKTFTAEGTATVGDKINTLNLSVKGMNINEGTLDAVFTVCPTEISNTPELTITLNASKASGVYAYKGNFNAGGNLEAGKYYRTPDVTLVADNTIAGTGEEGSPYIIDNAEKFQTITGEAGKNYLITSNIDFGGSTITPIETFAGTLDGGDMTLSNFNISTSNAKSGLIATNTGIVKNINISNVNTTKDTETTAFGIIVASNQGTISNCNISSANLTFSCNANGTNCGTIAGENITNNAVISDVVVENSTITINSGKAIAGMVVGLNGNWNSPTLKGAKVKNNNTITYNTGANNSSLGGVAGWNKGGQIIGTSSAINMYPKSSSHFGGIVGSNNNNGSVIASYCNGTISDIGSGVNAGGVVGDNASVMTGCYSSVSNSIPNLFGALIGKGNGTITESYYYNCNNGKRNGQTGPDLTASKVNNADGLKSKLSNLNTAIQSYGFKYVENSSDPTGNEPLILSKIEE